MFDSSYCAVSPTQNKMVARLDHQNKGQMNITMAPANRTGVRNLLKALKRGQSIDILPDQVPAIGKGVCAPFFGK
ncbi:MAG: hypothetical protein Q7J51_01700 [Sheuella sp.]|nr:hypothetical protein [Sheuella sp.]